MAETATRTPSANEAGDQPPAASEPQPEFVLEDYRRLSRSLLWQLQRRFFEQKGHQAWAERIVPSYITTNPFIANAYARVILGFIRDFAASTGPNGSGLDRSEPVYIVELGSGVGRLAFNIVQSLLDSLAHSSLAGVSIQYVLTDLAEKNIEFWETHPALQNWLQAGQLDFAFFDAEHPGPLSLRHSAKVLLPGAVKNPVVLVANYFFDSIPEDTFYVENGQLFESLLRLTYPEPEPNLQDPELFRRVNLVYHRQPANLPYYDDPDFNHLLETSVKELNQTAVDFPNVALECIRFFRDLSAGRLLLMTGDKGYDRPEDLADRKEPGYAVHGSFSMMVNYYLMGQYFANRGGEVLRTSYRYSGLNILGLLLGQPAGGYVETRDAFYEAIEKQGPDDFFNLTQGIEANLPSFTLEQILAYLRLSGWDSHLFYKCFPVLLEQVGAASERLQGEVRLAVAQLWGHYYYIGEESDLPFDLGMLLFKIGEHAQALEFFDRSLKLYGPAGSTYYNQAVCLYRFDRNEEALQAVDLALQYKPEMEQARKLRTAIQGALNKARQGAHT